MFLGATDEATGFSPYPLPGAGKVTGIKQCGSVFLATSRAQMVGKSLGSLLNKHARQVGSKGGGCLCSLYGDREGFVPAGPSNPILPRLQAATPSRPR